MKNAILAIYLMQVACFLWQMEKWSTRLWALAALIVSFGHIVAFFAKGE